MSAASELYCLLMAEFLVAAKETLRARFGDRQREKDLSPWLKRRSNRGKGEIA
jgi:hypothetical protein